MKCYFASFSVTSRTRASLEGERGRGGGGGGGGERGREREREGEGEGRREGDDGHSGTPKNANNIMLYIRGYSYLI